MLRWLLLPPAALILLLSAMTAQTAAGRILAAIAATAAVLILCKTKRPAGPRPAPSARGPVWRRPPRKHKRAELLEQAEARIGQPIQALCPLMLTAQDRPGERWHGSQAMWVALAEHDLWLLHDAAAAGIGGVWDQLLRTGLHIHAHEHRGHHHVELSWPTHARLLVGQLRGPREPRRRLLGLVAADELGLRELLNRPAH
jgi:hypothetical protein